MNLNDKAGNTIPIRILGRSYFMRRILFAGLCFLMLFLCSANEVKCQSPFEGLEPLFTEPKHYTAHFTKNEPVVDGNINESVWKDVSWSDKFIDIEGNKMPLPSWDTRVKMIWNDNYLFIAAKLEEPHVWATLKNRDEIVFRDNDFEVFIDPDNNVHQYFEIEVNAFNTIFDLFLPKPYRNGTRALIYWNVDKFKSAIQVQGSINDATDTDTSWTVEMAIPFSGVSIGTKKESPEEGTLWRINFSRVQWDVEVKDGKYVKLRGKEGRPLPEHNWVWSPQGVINMHYPERWGYLQFSRKEVGTPVSFTLPFAERQKQNLWLVYYKQKEYYRKHGNYASSLAELNLKEQALVKIDDQHNKIILEATNYQFMAMIHGHDNIHWSINQEGLIQKLK